jgi:hypothetical protein
MNSSTSSGVLERLRQLSHQPDKKGVSSMTRFSARPLVAALLLLAACAGRTPADPIYFEYATDIFTPSGSPTGQLDFKPTQAGAGIASIAGQGYVPGAGSSVIHPATLYLTIDYSLGGNSVYDPQAFILKLTLKDTASGDTGSLLFPGTFSGTVGGPGYGPVVTGALSFAPPANGAGASLVLGGNRYTVDPSQPPSWQGLDGGMLEDRQFFYYPIPFHIDAQPAGGGPVAAAPEPSGLVLAVLGVGTLGAAAWRRRRGHRMRGRR